MIRAMLVATILVATVGGVSAWEGPFEINNETFFDGDWSVAADTGTPIKNWKHSTHISAWINITGFRNESIINETRHVNGSAKDFAIVKKFAKYQMGHRERKVSFKSTCSISDSYVLNKTNTTTATQTSTLVYQVKKPRLLGGYKWVTQTPEKLTVSCTVESPETFNNTITDMKIIITSYNNSVTPYTLIYIPYHWKIIKETVEYKNNITHYKNKTGWVTTNSMGAEHVRFLNNTLHIEDPTFTVTRCAEYYVINEAPLNWSLLNISVFTPYVEITDVPCHITVMHSKPSDHVHWEILLVLASFIALCTIVSYKVVTGWRK